MSVPLVLIVIPYAIVVGLALLISLVNLYHLLHYGFFDFEAALFTYFFYGFVIILMFWAWRELSAIDWASATLILGA